MEQGSREMWLVRLLVEAQGVLEHVGDRESHGESDAHEGENELQGRVLARQVRVIDIDQPFGHKVRRMQLL